MSVDVTTRSFGNDRAGCYVDPTWPLTSTHVQKNGIRVVGELKLDDARGVEGQVLGVSGLTMRDGQKHNVVFVCDMSNRVYAFDADNYTLLWKQVVGRPIVVTKAFDMWGISPSWGILSTPVINTHTGILYAISASSPDGTMAKISYRLHSLSLADGSDVALPLVLDNATFTHPGDGKRIMLGSTPRKQRPGLTLHTQGTTTTVFAAFGSFLESSPVNVGIVLAIDVMQHASPSIAAMWCSGAGKYPSAGIWQAGQGLSVDADGYLHGMTGNGAFDPPNGYFGECFFKLAYLPALAGQAASIKCVDWWSPYSDAGRAGDDPTLIAPHTAAMGDMGDMPGMDMAAMPHMPTNAVNAPKPSNFRTVGDQDLGSGGALPLSSELTGFAKDVIIGGGKDGVYFCLDGNNLGKTQRQDFAPDKIQGNWKKLLSPPFAATWCGLGYNLKPDNLFELPVLPTGKTAHIHGSPVGYKSPDHGVMLFVQGENGPVQAIRLNADYSLTWLADGGVVASQGMGGVGGMPGGMLCLTTQHEADNTAVLWSCMPWYGDANRTVTAGRFVAWAANWIDESSGRPTLIKLWDSTQWGVNYSHAKFAVPTPFNGKMFVPSYDGRVLVFA